MLHILLLILKIIGIILAILIGCILLFLCLALFVPVHYRIELNRAEGEGSPPIEVKAKLTWLLHFVNISILYPSDIYLRVRILFITLFRLPGKHKESKKNKKEKKASSRKSKEKDKDKSSGQSKDEDEKETDTDENSIEKAEETYIEQEADNRRAEQKVEAPKVEVAKDESDETEAESEAEGTQNTKPKLSLKSKLDKIWSQIKNIWYTIKRICGKIKEILENIEYYLDVIKSDTFKQAFSLCKGELGAIFNYVKPRKFIADLTIGMDDPAATGQILSYYGILYPLIGSNVTITGDFDRKRIEGSIFVKGKIKLFTFLKAVIRIYFSKDIRKLLKLFKKEDA